MEMKENIVMTPKGKTANSTTIWIERKVDAENGGNKHVAGGEHRGIIINKETISPDDTVVPPSQLSLEFRVYLVNAQDGSHTQESRTLRFWFRSVIESEDEQASIAQEFFRELVTPQDFPKNNIGFIMKIMKLLQHGYQGIIRIEILYCQLVPSSLPVRPISPDESSTGKVVELTEEKLREIIESSYPNPVTVQDIAKEYDWSDEDVENLMQDLRNRGIIKPMDHGAYTRVTQDDTQIQIVKQMPKMVRAKQPTIAIITALYPEKLAVDAMMENKETFVRYTTVGESNVYTLGNIGEHRVVCTKLPTIGHTREAMTAAGNTTTRLLGTFQSVEYVILVGVAGGVPHFTDYTKHVRLGDVIISYPTTQSKATYIYCELATEVGPNKFTFETKEYSAPNTILQDTAAKLKAQSDNTIDGKPSWLKYLKTGLKSLELESEHDFKRPPVESDKLYMAIGERDLIEVTHPVPQDNNNQRLEGCPRLHLSAIGSGRDVARSDLIRQQFSQQHKVLAFDPEFDSVIQSVLGNCRESFLCVRGICDYKDGTRKTEWQCYAALAAASFTKAIIEALEPLPSS